MTKKREIEVKKSVKKGKEQTVNHQDKSLFDLTDEGLFQLFAAVIKEMRDRKIVKTWNNPVADYAEMLVAKKLGLTLQTNSNAGYDAVDRDGTRYEIKSRRLTRQNGSCQLSALRNLRHKNTPFDVLIVVFFNADFSVAGMYRMPVLFAKKHARYQKHTNSYILVANKKLLASPEVSLC